MPPHFASELTLIRGASSLILQSKLVKISNNDPDSDVWEDGEWEKTLQMLLEEDLLPTMPQEGF
jgi:hypothetical protein